LAKAVLMMWVSKTCSATLVIPKTLVALGIFDMAQLRSAFSAWIQPAARRFER